MAHVQDYVQDCRFDATFEDITSTYEPMYSLEMNDGMSDVRQQVDITREEFIALKKYLCELRGLKPADSAKRGEEPECR